MENIIIVIGIVLIILTIIVCYTIYKIKENKNEYRKYIESKMLSIKDYLMDIHSMLNNIDCATSDIQDILENKEQKE